MPFHLAGPAFPDGFPLPFLCLSRRLGHIGPSGVLLQAHVVAAIMYQQQQLSSLDINAEQQASLLATALASTVWQVCSDHLCLIARHVHAVNIDQASCAGRYVPVTSP